MTARKPLSAALGLLGGTFDPIHIGHLRIAIETCERLGLEGVELLPAADPPLKAAPLVAADHRLAMVERAVLGVEQLRVNSLELGRSGPSYTVDTLLALRATHGPERPLVFIVGEDVLPTLPQWYRWESLLSLCHLAVLVRPGAADALPAPVAGWLSSHEVSSAAIHEAPAGGVIRVRQPPMAISSTAVRSALSDGTSVQFLLPEAVIEYIREHELYGARATPHVNQ